MFAKIIPEILSEIEVPRCKRLQKTSRKHSRKDIYAIKVCRDEAIKSIKIKDFVRSNVAIWHGILKSIIYFNQAVPDSCCRYERNILLLFVKDFHKKTWCPPNIFHTGIKNQNAKTVSKWGSRRDIFKNIKAAT